MDRRVKQRCCSLRKAFAVSLTPMPCSSRLDYTNWFPNEPNDASGAEDEVELGRTFDLRVPPQPTSD